ncbi:Hsp20/alpha crystallin family protein [Cellvibrio japonicus]|uniref:Small heat shock protein n=1 Tax=Cellvibrio japonicus (strain Ueda107) TaxID=498211 RepID=B3PBC0_CELJU|nr:Hsp20/alpha crystallin family protein [Cellvibrio japonicus]ACE82872.1 small heat shock protein [Cellvibrio japonicus Ueda107]QEI11702.1 Hsp20/alpha crystallin family protein [Cellvibrio japonicus]QEI15276.1 Hsp20/alpha crystallin family protein [Cellvibrio japonicus]QEI18856.1 Hsp20/alpha crystallin family protein [Cellvibrio japonicus]
MNLQQLNPWNWFKHEENRNDATIPVKRSEPAANAPAEPDSRPPVYRSHWPMLQLQRDIDHLFEQALRGFGLPSVYSDWLNDSVVNRVGFQAKLNVASDDKQYHISLEAPGLTDKDITLELHQGVLSIRGEKKEESETSDRHYYRIERSYGSFQRTLTLPEDCDQDAITAAMENGVLDIRIPRKPVAGNSGKRIPIN